MFDLPVYNNKSNFSPGRYRVDDLSRHKGFFVQVDGSDLHMKWHNDFESSTARNLDLYYRPSLFPLLDHTDFTRGSCWKDWLIPTSAYEFIVDKDTIRIGMVDRDLSIKDYLDFVYQQIETNIKEIYQKHPYVCLHYSGGIDAMVVLSYLIKMDLLSRTVVVYCRNLAQANEDFISFRSPILLSAVKEVLRQIKNQCLDVVTIDIDVGDIAKIANIGNFFNFQAHSSALIMQRYPEYGHIDGAMGNYSLFHQEAYIKRLIKRTQDHEDFHRSLERNPNRYTVVHVDLDTIDSMPPMDHYHIGNKISGQGLHDTKLYIPLGTPDILRLSRRLKLDDYTHDDILNATHARNIIERNTGKELIGYVKYATPREHNSLKHIIFPMDLLDPKILEIDLSPGHCPEGLDWLQHEIAQGETTGSIPVNVVVSILAQRYISKEYIRSIS